MKEARTRLDYQEYPPPVRLAPVVECFWTIAAGKGGVYREQRVTPDGCADILFTEGGKNPRLEAVGAMTRFVNVNLRGGERVTGMRFRPGMWAKTFRTSPRGLTDQVLPLRELWGPEADSCVDQLQAAPNVSARLGILAGLAQIPPRLTSVQRAVQWMEQQRGQVCLCVVASQAGLSCRQFRRVCAEETGLSPKTLARILRFRHARSRAATEKGEHAGLAVDCGFSDQAHMVAEFRHFSGRTPGTE